MSALVRIQPYTVHKLWPVQVPSLAVVDLFTGSDDTGHCGVEVPDVHHRASGPVAGGTERALGGQGSLRALAGLHRSPKLDLPRGRHDAGFAFGLHLAQLQLPGLGPDLCGLGIGMGLLAGELDLGW